MSKTSYKKILAKQRRITKRTNLFISKHKVLANIGMAVFVLLLFLAVSGIPSKIINSSYVSKLLSKNNSISSNFGTNVDRGTSNMKVCNANDAHCLGTDNNTPDLVKTNQTNNNTSNDSKNYGSYYIPPVCTTTAIPYSTSYKDASYMDVGQTSSYGGIDGWTKICTADSKGWKPTDITDPPFDKVVYSGTRQSTPATPPANSQNYNAKLKCDSDYNRAMAQIANANAGDSSAVAAVQQAYGSCLRNAGF
jgi:hypothetical protein